MSVTYNRGPSGSWGGGRGPSRSYNPVAVSTFDSANRAQIAADKAKADLAAKANALTTDKSELDRLKSSTDSVNRKLDAGNTLLNASLPNPGFLNDPRMDTLGSTVLNVRADPLATLGGLSKNYKVPTYGSSLGTFATDIAKTAPYVTALNTLDTGDSPLGDLTNTLTGITGAMDELKIPGAGYLDKKAQQAGDSLNRFVEGFTKPVSKYTSQIPGVTPLNKRITAAAKAAGMAPGYIERKNRQEWTTSEKMREQAEKYRQEIAKHKAKIAAGDKRHGLFNIESRKDSIGTAQERLDKLSSVIPKDTDGDFLAQKYAHLLGEAGARGDTSQPPISPEMQKAWEFFTNEDGRVSQREKPEPPPGKAPAPAGKKWVYKTDNYGITTGILGDERWQLVNDPSQYVQTGKGPMLLNQAQAIPNPITNPEGVPGTAAATKRAGLDTVDAQSRLNSANTLLNDATTTAGRLRKYRDEDEGNLQGLIKEYQAARKEFNDNPSTRTKAVYDQLIEAKGIIESSASAVDSQAGNIEKGEGVVAGSRTYQGQTQQSRFDATDAQRMAALQDLAANVNAPMSQRTEAVRSLNGLLSRLERTGIDVKGSPEYAAAAALTSALFDIKDAPSPGQAVADAPGRFIDAVNPARATHAVQSAALTALLGDNYGRKFADSNWNPINLGGKVLNKLWQLGPQAIADLPGDITHHLRGQNLDRDGDGVPDKTFDDGRYKDIARVVEEKARQEDVFRRQDFIDKHENPDGAEAYLTAREDGHTTTSAAFLARDDVTEGPNGGFEFQGEVYDIRANEKFENGRTKEARHQILEQQGWKVDPSIGANGTWTPPGYTYAVNPMTGEKELAKKQGMSVVFRQDAGYTSPPQAPTWAQTASPAIPGAEDNLTLSPEGRKAVSGSSQVKAWNSDEHLGFNADRAAASVEANQRGVTTYKPYGYSKSPQVQVGAKGQAGAKGPAGAKGSHAATYTDEAGNVHKNPGQSGATAEVPLKDLRAALARAKLATDPGAKERQSRLTEEIVRRLETMPMDEFKSINTKDPLSKGGWAALGAGGRHPNAYGTYTKDGVKYETNERGDWKKVLPDGTHEKEGKIHYFGQQKHPRSGHQAPPGYEWTRSDNQDFKNPKPHQVVWSLSQKKVGYPQPHGMYGPKGARGEAGPTGKVAKIDRFGNKVQAGVEYVGSMIGDAITQPMAAVANTLSHPITTGRNLLQKGKRTLRDAVRLPVSAARVGRGVATGGINPSHATDLVNQVRSVGSAFDPYGAIVGTAASPREAYMRQLRDAERERQRRIIDRTTETTARDVPSPQPFLPLTTREALATDAFGKVTVGR